MVPINIIWFPLDSPMDHKPSCDSSMTPLWTTVFVDDLLINSKNVAEHELHLKKALEQLRAAGAQANIKKCELHVTQPKYLGFISTTDGIEADPEKTEVIQNWAVPTTVRDVQSFLGFCHFHRRLIKDYSRIAQPLS